MRGVLGALLCAVAAVGDAPVPAGYGAMLLRVVLALGGVCALAYLTLRFLGRRVQSGSGGLMRVVARLPLEPRRTLYVVEAAGRYLLVGGGENGAPALLTELDAEAVRRLTAAPPRKVSFLEVLTGRAGQAAPPIIPARDPAQQDRDAAEGRRR
jgi:flagellar biogenesis protein FliO